MIILSRSEIEAVVDLGSALGTIEAAYIAASEGRATMPPVGYLAFPERDGDCHIKYGHIAGDPSFVVKIASGFYGNPSIGLPTSNGVMLVFSASTGVLEAILLDEGFLTDLRTGLGGAIATRALCRPDARRVAIVGTGIQARWQIRCLRQAMKQTPLAFSIWGRSENKARETASALASEGIDLEVAPDLERLCRGVDIIITTTPSREPLIHDAWIRPGTHITAIGADAPGKQELDTSLVIRADRRIGDRLEQSLDHGEFSTVFKSGLMARKDCAELGAVLCGKAAGRTRPDDITIADLTGIAVQDIAITNSILDAYRLSSVSHPRKPR
ncbi:ornithine cyclodeaminase family protein [Rhizobium herbae]|uniref:Ornithine cyclodeaminase n=1 Tax=Rhizobium herbae TaxID=508661 RepID=A0ABS4EQC7_9HYPH|nr:ornithine cyclodeaminase family protein [Rhizobium herbae]MBP1860150.1 ornithine cyclodeaminase [Rhizobium herbae]